MTNLLPVLAFSSSDFAQAERLLDLMAAHKRGKASGYILLVSAPDTHPEQHKRLQIAAKVGFEHVGMLTVGWPAKDAPKTKAEGINWLFSQAAAHVKKHYKTPFVWIEPDCVVTNAQWLEILTHEYSESPKRYLGSILANEKQEKHLGRVAVYPNDCAEDLKEALKSNIPFNVAAMGSLVAKASKSHKFQVLNISESQDFEKVRPDAVIVHGDKMGMLLERKTSESPGAALPTLEEVLLTSIRPSVVTSGGIESPTPKLDGRSKAAREARKKAETVTA